MQTALYPHDRAKPTHRRTVGSSAFSSAVLGLRPMNKTYGACLDGDSAQLRQRLYR